VIKLKKLLVIIGVIGIIHIIKRMLNREEYIKPVKCPYIIEKYGNEYQVRYNA
jgi:hypothetical protein